MEFTCPTCGVDARDGLTPACEDLTALRGCGYYRRMLVQAIEDSRRREAQLRAAGWSYAGRDFDEIAPDDETEDVG